MISSGGSSPHARGLLVDRHRIKLTPRIIPARAGFTADGFQWCHGHQDHPRTRGVYVMMTSGSGMRFGSSPHARGLPPQPRKRAAQRRIIPARAGFTAGKPLRGAVSVDHPRTRGVYVFGASEVGSAAGSSPHARGLPCRPDQPLGRRGIIPARAGFTGRRADRLPLARDHPRTRGVYHAYRHAGYRKRRIIPARAGFTLLRMWPVRLSSGSSPRVRGLLVPVGG